MRIAMLAAAGAAILALSTGSALAADALSPQTRANLETAMHGEAFAHLKYETYAEAARERGREDLAKLFEQSAKVEADEHFAREAGALKLAGTDEANLADAMKGEHYEATTMYVRFAAEAEKAGDRKVAAMFRQIAEDESDHYAKYKAALEQLKVH
jgi:rubrerythrin